MSTPNFRFKQFTVWHDRCAMKVGTDGVLLGAWAPIPGSAAVPSPTAQRSRILDVGTGSGLIALMLAQRCHDAEIDAIDIDEAAVQQAQANFADSPWADRLHAYHTSLQNFQLSTINYQLIVSNPPYFTDSLKNPDLQRQTARHMDSLSYRDLLGCSAQLLDENGRLALVLPAEAEAVILAEAERVGLSAERLTRVYSKPGKPVKRILVAFKKGTGGACKTDDFYIESDTSPRSEQYAKLTEDFYL